ncbi:MAG: hypothetical protein ACOX5G_06430 [Kiritimatiellia bacterium]|jgi:hypothetical protein
MANSPSSAEALLKDWCDGLVRLQIRGYGSPHDGGFLCPACSVIHGRADNAFYPLLFLFQRTGDAAYLEAAKLVFDWHRRILQPDGAAYNDLNSPWTGTTVFSAIGYWKALRFCGEAMDEDLKSRVETRLRSEAAWVFETFRLPPRLDANINYMAAAACVLATCGTFFGNDGYVEEARKLVAYCLEHVTKNGFLAGEGGAHDAVSTRGCRPIDIGYNLEESIPNLVEAADALDDAPLLKRLAGILRAHLEFLLPDGAIDNSIGTRNIKWTYYGSRTSDGCLGALARLGRDEPLFRDAARRHLSLLQACTSGGMLYGGRRYRNLSQPPCTHHSLCHAVALADAVRLGMEEDGRVMTLPCEEPGPRCRRYPELGAFQVAVGPFLATITASDFPTGGFQAGLSHASGGTMTLLYHRDRGPIVAGSTYAYELVEPLNMQLPVGALPHAPLLPRLELESDGGRRYVSCLDPNVVVRSEIADHCVTLAVRARKFDLAYTFGKKTVKLDMTVRGGPDAKNPVLILPVVAGTCGVETRNPCTTRDIFWLPGGFKAVEHTLRPNANSRIVATLRP